MVRHRKQTCACDLDSKSLKLRMAKVTSPPTGCQALRWPVAGSVTSPAPPSSSSFDLDAQVSAFGATPPPAGATTGAAAGGASPGAGDGAAGATAGAVVPGAVA